MMTLYEKIIAIYPELIPTNTQNVFIQGLIRIENAGDNRGDYIAKWEHPTLAKPTDEELT
jgi:hypothetical protein